MKRELTTVIPLAALGAAFLLVSLMVVLTRNHPWFVGKKLRLGALIIGINAAAVGGVHCGPMCYDSIEHAFCIFTETEQCQSVFSIEIATGEVATIEGKVYSSSSNSFSFQLKERGEEGQLLQSGNLEPIHGSFDVSEEFRFTIDATSLVPKSYDLVMYACDVDSIAANTSCHAVWEFDLLVTD